VRRGSISGIISKPLFAAGALPKGCCLKKINPVKLFTGFIYYLVFDSAECRELYPSLILFVVSSQL
jgi:hypothetical protein